MKSYIFISFLILLTSCKVKIEPPKIPDLEKLEIYSHDYPSALGDDSLGAVILDANDKPITLAAIKLVVNDSVCINAYSNFDGQFGVLFDKNRITTKSHFIIVFEGYSRKIVPFNQFSEKEIIVLDKKSAIITHQEYRDFYESIRSCTR